MYWDGSIKICNCLKRCRQYSTNQNNVLHFDNYYNLINHNIENNADLKEVILAYENYFVPMFTFDVMIFNVTLLYELF